ncbi:MAG: IclR family transcriptional regulator [Bryobacteraceae bacterium]
MASSSGDTEYRVQVLDRAFAILTTLASSDFSLAPSDIGDRLKLNKSTVHRILRVLERNRFVERDLDNGRYRLGLKLVELGSIALSRFDLNRLARPFIERLVTQTGETAHLGILRQTEVISLVNAEGRHNVRTPSTVGRRSPVHCTSLGKVLLAFQTQPVVDSFLRSYRFTPYTKRTIRNSVQFRAELANVRRHGFAVDDEEFEEGLRCVGAPVRDHSGKVIAAISIAGPAFRVTSERMPELIRSVVNVAADLSASLGNQQAAGARASGTVGAVKERRGSYESTVNG